MISKKPFVRAFLYGFRTSIHLFYILFLLDREDDFITFSKVHNENIVLFLIVGVFEYNDY